MSVNSDPSIELLLAGASEGVQCRYQQAGDGVAAAEVWRCPLVSAALINDVPFVERSLYLRLHLSHISRNLPVN